MAHDLRFALRALWKNPGFSLAALFVLALGIGANVAIFSVVDAVLLRPLPFTDPERLVIVWEAYFPQLPKVGTSTPDYLDWRAQNHVFDQMGAYRYLARNVHFTGRGEPERLDASLADAAFLPALGVAPALGRWFTQAEDTPAAPPVAVLSHALWARRFASDPRVLGQSITLDDMAYTVIGVLPESFEPPLRVDLWLPFGRLDAELASRVYHPLGVIGRLKPGVSLQQARTDLRAILARLAEANPATDRGFSASVIPLRDEIVGDVGPALRVLFGAVLVVLLVACVNVAGLVLSRGAGRAKELAVRAALGAGRARLARLLLAEGMVLALGAAIGGVLLAFCGLPLLVAMAPVKLPHAGPITLDARALGFAVALALLTPLAFSLAPALRASSTDLNEALKQGGRSSAESASGRLRRVLVVGELALAMLLLVAASLTIRSLEKLLGIDPGFDPARVVTMRMSYPTKDQPDAASIALLKRLRDELKTLPGVREVASITMLPFRTEPTQKTRFAVEGQAPVSREAVSVAELRFASSSYFEAMGIPLLRGRFFTKADERQPRVIINEALAHRYFPHDDPIGKRINTATWAPKPFWYTVIGVVGDVKQLAPAARPTFDLYDLYSNASNYLVVRTAGDPKPLIGSLRGAVRKVDPDVAVSEIATMEERLAASTGANRFLAWVLGVFSGAAWLLAAVGLYSVTSYLVAQRNREIGIRMALGAEHHDVLRMVLGGGMKLAAAGIALGAVGALALTRLLVGMVYGIRTTDALSFLAAAAVILIVAVPANYLPARRAARVDPAAVLRGE